MKNTSFNVAALMVVLLLSAMTMLWLFWRFPILTTIAAAGTLIGLAVSTSLATSTDLDGLTEPEHGVRSR
jgi:hypothetical protein